MSPDKMVTLDGERMSETKVIPCRGWVLLQPIPLSDYAETKLHIPDSVKAEWGLPRARVISIGNMPKLTAMGDQIPYNCKPGDVVMHRTGGGFLFGKPSAGDAFMLLEDNQVVAVVETEEVPNRLES